MNNINNITLNYFANKLQYNSIIEKNNRSNDNNFILEKKFYKKRIIDLTKKLFKSDGYESEIRNHFDNYVKSCIVHLKSIDKSDILQANYTNMNDIITLDNSNNNCHSHDTYVSSNELLFKTEEVKQINLDTFIVNKGNKKNKKILPKKQEFNIKTDEYKTKGIKNKGNKKEKYQ